jgi:hypothetical protein
VHRSDYLELLVSHEIPQDLTVLKKALSSETGVRVRNLLHEILVLGGVLTWSAAISINRRPYVTQQLSEHSEFCAINGALDCAAFTVTQHDEQLRPFHLSREFGTAGDVIAWDVSGNADAEDVADALVEHEFWGDTGVDAPNDHCKRKLSARRCPDLTEEVAVPHVLRQEPRVASFKFHQGIVWAQVGLPLSGWRRALIGGPSLAYGSCGTGEGSDAAEVSS